MEVKILQFVTKVSNILEIRVLVEDCVGILSLLRSSVVNSGLFQFPGEIAASCMFSTDA